ncbi:MAG: 3-oxoadipate CoA-transferase, partial [Cytophagales bacterium]|nr:3-oxoadipate CoA-transferase [Rhizobacter sp.]
MFVVMDHLDKHGAPKIVPACTYPLTGRRVVNRIYTDLAVIDVADGTLTVRAMVPGLGFDELQSMTGAALTPGF